MRFRRKCLEKQTHIDNFLYFLYIFSYLKKNSVNFRKKNWKNFENNFFKFFIFEKKVGKKLVKSRLIHQSKDRKFSVKMSVNLKFSKKKIEKNFENNFFKFFIFEKKVGTKSVKSRLIHRSNDRKLSVKMSFNLGYFPGYFLGYFLGQLAREKRWKIFFEF